MKKEKKNRDKKENNCRVDNKVISIVFGFVISGSWYIVLINSKKECLLNKLINKY